MALLRDIRVALDCLKLCRTRQSLLRLSRPYSTPTPSSLAAKPLAHQDEDTLSSKSYVSTFDPSALKPSDYVDVSSKPSVYLRDIYSTARRPSRLIYTFHHRPLPFPPNTRGFFYLYRPPTTQHVAAGQLRFRLVDTPDPTKFAEGRDLLVDGETWSMHLLTLQKHPSYRQIYEFVTSQAQREQIDAFITRSRLANSEVHCDHYRHHSTVLDSILDPFVINFSNNDLALLLLDPKAIVRVRLSNMFVVQPSVTKGMPFKWDPTYGKSPYHGRALCRFELVTFPRKRRGPKPKLAIRVVEWIERPRPPDPPSSTAEAAIQEEGEFMRKYDIHAGMQRVWTKGTSRIPTASMEMLEEAYLRGKTPASQEQGLRSRHVRPQAQGRKNPSTLT